jgi:hypothetical protein
MNNQIVDFERKNLNILHSLPYREKGEKRKIPSKIHPSACRHLP